MAPKIVPKLLCWLILGLLEHQQGEAITEFDVPFFVTLKLCAAQCKNRRMVQQPGNQSEVFYYGEGAKCVLVHTPKKGYICCRKIRSKPPHIYLKRCQDAINQEETHGVCISDPCQHGGTCIPEDNTFHCTCSQKYDGEFCEVHLDLKKGICEQEKTCHNGGICQNVNDKYPLNFHLKLKYDALNSGKMQHMLKNLSEYLERTSMFKNAQTQERGFCLCHHGYRGFSCDQPCKPRTWGPYCIAQCTHGCAKCRVETGRCLKCPLGYRLDPQDDKGCIREPCNDKLCKPGKGKCNPRGDCACEDYYSGLWCNTHCSKFEYPRHGRNCRKLCGRCTTLPCNVQNGMCPLPPDKGSNKCQDGFHGDNCDEIDTGGLQMICKLLLRVFDDSDIRDFNDPSFTEGMQDLDAHQTMTLETEFDSFMVQQLNGEAYDRISFTIEETGKGKRSVTHSRRNSGPGISVEFAVLLPPHLASNRSSARRRVVQKIKKNSHKFKSEEIPGLAIDKGSIRITQVQVLKTEEQDATSSMWHGSWILGLVAVLVVLCVMVTLLYLAFNRRNRAHTWTNQRRLTTKRRQGKHDNVAFSRHTSFQA